MSSKLLVVNLTALGVFSAYVEAPIREDSLRDKVRIEGVVTYDGRLPAPIPVGEAATSRRLIEVDPKMKGLKDAVVWLEGLSDLATQRNVADHPVIMDQQNFFFVPHVLSVESGQAVEFRNSDLANHGVTAASLEPRNQFNVMIPHSGHFTHRFVTSKHPVAIGCPIHAAMSGWIFVFDHRLHAVTDDRGRFALPPVPAGRYTLRVHHPDSGLRRTLPITIEADKPSHLLVEFHDRDRKGSK
jgi:plastocyanin